MRVAYDHDLKVAGVGMVPWRRLGPEQWLPHYAIISLDGNGGVTHGPRTVSLSSRDTVVTLPKRNTRTLLADERFQHLIDSQLPDYDLMLYRATEIPPQLASHKILMADEQLVRTYENKVQFRRLFSGKAPFVPFNIVEKAELHTSEAAYVRLCMNRNGMVMQDARLSGGQGTYLVRDFASYGRAVKELTRAGANDDPIVISDLLTNVKELSVQACVTRYGIFTGPLQRQIIREPSLYLDVPGTSGFCGIQILASDQGTSIHKQAEAIAQRVGSVLQGAGYQGIFGIDLLQASTGEVYLLEANPRITGATPLLTALYSDQQGIPFYLLHILELGNYDYEIVDRSITFDDTEGALLVVHSQQDSSVLVTELPIAGTYRMVDGGASRTSDNLKLDNLAPGECIVLPQAQVGGVVRPGGMLFSVHLNGQIFDLCNNRLYNDTTQLISTLRKKVTWHEY